MKAITLLLIVVLAFMIIAKTTQGFPRKQWKQLIGTLEIYNEARCLNYQIEHPEYFEIGCFRINEYGDTLSKRIYLVKNDEDAMNTIMGIFRTWEMMND